ncbi:MAG TPA: ABC transporter ATP-binding protein [Candidatus Dormibacteraeota bacterium]|nr:ABC transporter ATP-binding protein [Candidatus Dormibacteraeota bacterium]
MTSPEAPGLAVSGLTKRFGKTLAVDNLDFAIEPGHIMALLGPNGAGKTTTLMSLAGLLRPDAGRMTWQGRELGPNRGRQVALITETPEVYEMLSVWEHMVFVGRSCNLPDGWRERAQQLLQRMSMWEQRDTLGEALSKGMRQRLLIAATMLAATPILLLDEPMIGLDPIGQHELRNLLLEVRDGGTTVIVSTHLLSNVQSFCDRLLILNRGRAVAAGGLQELLDRYGNQTLEETFLQIVQ